MVNYLVITFEEKWKQAKLPYITRRYMRTKASQRMHASVERARKWAETIEVKESDGKPYTRTLKYIELDDGLSKRIMWERKEA